MSDRFTTTSAQLHHNESGAVERFGPRFSRRTLRVSDPREIRNDPGGVVDAFVLQKGEGRSIDLGGFTMSVKAEGSETDQAFSLLEASEPPGFGPPLHIHRDAAEAFYVVEGEYIIFLPPGEVRCLPVHSSSFRPAWSMDSG